MPDALSDFLDQPSADSFLALRRAVTAAPEFDMNSNGLTRLEELVAQGRYDAARDLTPELMPNWLLSPRTHRLLGYAAGERGETDRQQSENTLAEACLHGMSATGDGSAENPYSVVHVADEYDIADALGKAPVSQRRAGDGGAALDVLVCDDGSEIWFDVTAGLAAMAERGGA